MQYFNSSASRRGFFRLGLGVAAGVHGLANAQPATLPKPAAPAPRTPLVVAQLADMSAEQQDISRDFLVGARAAWQDIQQHGGLGGRTVQHLTLELDGSAGALAEAWKTVHGNPNCVAVFGTTGDRMAAELDALMRATPDAPLPHVAPWLQNAAIEIGPRTFPIFAGRRQQIGFAVRSLSVVGVSEIGAVYATPRDLQLYRTDVEKSAADMKLQLRTVLPGARLPALPAVVLFVGGTPELLRFCRSIEAQSVGRQQFVVALADVNLANLSQAGIPRSVPIIATQPVPVVTAGLPIVRSYRDALARLFDEPPTPHSLAGFMAARYTANVIAGSDITSRASALAAFQRRSDLDLGGFRVSFDADRRGSTYVTQSMLTSDGRSLG